MLCDNHLRCMNRQSAELYQRADAWCGEIISSARDTIDQFGKDNSLDWADMCFIVVGSIGRNEALDASDMDIVPIARNEDALAAYRESDQSLRQVLRESLGLAVSRGFDLTEPSSVESLVEAESIGGSEDTSQKLTKRILVLTEGREIETPGPFRIENVCLEILEAYGSKERTRGRHALSLCNDIARYYRTLCVEYKTKADAEDADWCTRNLKLRHSRKMWYFANIVAIVNLAESFPQGDEEYNDKLRQEFLRPPLERLGGALFEEQPIVTGRLLEAYAYFLEFMSNKDHRQALSVVKHEQRYKVSLDNPFPMMKFNSDLLHQHMVQIVNGLPLTKRQRIFDWFLL